MTIEGIFITNSPFWCVHLLKCENVICRGLRYDAKLVNNDGIDPEMTCNLLIEDIDFNNGDDNVAIKAGRDNDGWHEAQPSENIIIRNCRFKGLHGLVVGSEMSAGVRNVFVEDCTYGGYNKRALYVKTNPNRGGFVHDIYFRNCEFGEMEDLFYITSMYANQGADDNHFTDIHDIHVKDIHAKKVNNAAIVLQGTKAKPLKNISFERINVDECKVGFSSVNAPGVTLTDCNLGGTVDSAPSEVTKKDNLFGRESNANPSPRQTQDRLGSEEAADPWSKSTSWFSGSLTPDKDKVDVLYLVSTNVASARDSAGNVSLRSMLTPEDRKYIDKELQFVKDSIFYGFNFISPYYHQYTFESFMRYPEKVDSVSMLVGDEVCGAFDYYMKHINNGRRFILAGFSQGGEITLHVLRHMTKDEYSRMVAAYVIGYKVTASDTINYATIRPAHGETDTGVVVSYNSALSTDGIWDVVSGGTVACINPVNWKTDSTPAEFLYHGKPHKVHVDKQHNVLIVDADPEYYHQWMKKSLFSSISELSADNLHHWDILFYDRQIHDNAVKRSLTN